MRPDKTRFSPVHSGGVTGQPDGVHFIVVHRLSIPPQQSTPRLQLVAPRFRDGKGPGQVGLLGSPVAGGESLEGRDGNAMNAHFGVAACQPNGGAQ